MENFGRFQDTMYRGMDVLDVTEESKIQKKFL